jgi:hypothetical protein
LSLPNDFPGLSPSLFSISTHSRPEFDKGVFTHHFPNRHTKYHG